MAAPSDISRKNTTAPQGFEAQLVAEFNKAVTALRAIATKLDADATVTDTNYASTITENGSSSPAKIELIPS